MNKQWVAALGLLLIVSPLSAHAATQTVALVIEKANCALCAPVVKRALAKVPGVKTVKVVEGEGEAPAVATVTYDDAAANVGALTKATANAGFPSRVKK